MRTSSVLLILLLAALVGLSVFGYFAWRAVTMERANAEQARREFATVRDTFEGTEPMLRVDASGQVVRGTAPIAVEGQRPSQLNLLVYHAGRERLARANVPFWFFKLKGPAVQFALRGTEVDLKRLGVTAADLEKRGPGLVLDETRSNGDRLLVWTE